MKKLVVLALLLFCTCVANAGPSKPNATSYTIPVHVSAARWVPEGSEAFLQLDVVIAGTKYELQGRQLSNKKISLLTPGDYKARLASESQDASGAFARNYELLLLDNSTWLGAVSSVSE
jgi:hypothetical protein